MQTNLTGFAAWFAGIWGYEPFPWQVAMAEGMATCRIFEVSSCGVIYGWTAGLFTSTS